MILYICSKEQEVNEKQNLNKSKKIVDNQKNPCYTKKEVNEGKEYTMSKLLKVVETLMLLVGSKMIYSIYIPTLITDMAIKQMDINYPTPILSINNLSSVLQTGTFLVTLIIAIIIWRKEIQVALKEIKNNI